MPRPKVRPATFILPRTGARFRGFVNLGRSDHSHENGNHVVDEERRPLLGDSSSDDEEESIASSQQRRRRAGRATASWSRLNDRMREAMWATCSSVYRFATSELGQGVLKCSLAYLLGSLATFVPFIARFLGRQDGKHVVATITVYFHPARSAGSMFKALICAFLAFLYAAFVSITSMCVAMLFENLNMLPLGHAVVLLLFCGGGLGFVGWTKQRMNDPLVNVACSLASLSLITVLTKEGDVQRGSLSFAKISQTLKMLILGVSATMAVSFLLFPISARKKLRANMVSLTGTLATLLAGVTESFLSGSEADMQDARFVQALAENKRAYGQLDQLVKEAKLEHYVAGTEREYRLEKRLARCLQDINQNMGGLQSAAALQFQILRQAQNSQASARSRTSFQKSSLVSSPGAWSTLELTPTLTSMNERVHNGPAPEQDYGFPYSPQRMFDVFIEHLGPSMRSLAFTLKEIFDDLPFGPGPDYKVSFNSKYRTSLDRALSLYRAGREEALASVYREKDFARISSPAVEADLEEVSASCGHFSFSLMEFGEQLKDLLSILDDLQLESEERPYGRSWSWLKFWQYMCSGGRSASRIVNNAVERPVIRKRPTLEQGLIQDKQAQRRLGYRIWKSLAFFRRDETKFALKVGVGAALYALPAFVSSTRPTFSRWRGEWGLLSYMLVCSMTIGASNTTGYARFLGTCLGACCAVVAWYITAGNVFGLAILGWVMAFWTAYIILVRKQGPMGRFIMLTYNLSVLYAYSLTVNDDDNDDDEGGPNPIITEIVVHRVVAVLTGCIWGIIVTRMIWPISAREKLKHGLSLLWLQMSLIWKRDPLSTMVDGRPASAYLTARERLLLERYLSRLEALQVAAKSEFELRSPFPETAYRNLLLRTRSMLNAFYAMNMQILKSPQASEGEVCLLQYTTQERQQLSSRISHLLSVLASSMKLEYPLIEALPNIEHARDRLLARIYHYRRDADMTKRTTDADYALLYAYVLVTGQLGSEIVELIGEISRLFGVLRDDVIELQ